MKKIFNQKIIAILLLASFVFVPQKSLAYNQNSVCRKIFSIESNIIKEQNKVRNETNEKRGRRSFDIKQDWVKRDQMQKQERENTENMFVGLISSLQNKAKTELEKQAVADFEKKVKEALAKSRTEIDSALAKYETDTLAILSNQDALSEKYFKEIEKESGDRLGNIRNLCKEKSKNTPQIKNEIENMRKMSDRGLARSAFLRKGKLEIDRLISARNKKVEEVRLNLVSEINALYNSLPESLR